ncbi:MAG: hypothetical protein ABI342_00875 [Nitrososphaera sp.]|jgi:hypothetical protein
MVEESIEYSKIDFSQCWALDESQTDYNVSIYHTLDIRDQSPSVKITNDTGIYELTFKKSCSGIRLADKKAWYEKTDLSMMSRIG